MDFSTFEIGSTVQVTLKSVERFMGELISYNEKSATITLKKVRILCNKDQMNQNSTFGEIFVECQQIQKIEIMTHESFNQSSNIVQLNNTEVVKNIAVPPLFALNRVCQVPNLSCFPGWKPINLQNQQQEPMENFCKKLFENSNFARLIPSVGRNRDKPVEIGLPQYFLKFHREPSMTINSQQCQQLVSAQPKEDTENDIQFHDCVEQISGAPVVSQLPSKSYDTTDIQGIQINQLTSQMDSLNLSDGEKSEDLLMEVEDLSRVQELPFLRYTNGNLSFNESLNTTLFQPGDQSSSTANTSLCIEDTDSYAMDCQPIE